MNPFEQNTNFTIIPDSIPQPKRNNKKLIRTKHRKFDDFVYQYEQNESLFKKLRELPSGGALRFSRDRLSYLLKLKKQFDLSFVTVSPLAQYVYLIRK